MFPGIIGRKIGMTQLFLESGEAIAVTAIQAGPSVVTQLKSRHSDGYDAIQVGFVEDKVNQSRLNLPEKGHLRGLENVRHLHEFRIAPDFIENSSVKRGDKVDVTFLKQGDRINITGFSKGRGFAGVVKRYHFAGGPKSHGQTDRHRAPGSIGASSSPGRVLKGKPMAGHMGNRRVTTRNLEVIKTDPERNLLLVKGAVPGANGGLLIIEKAR
ncbi:MAG: 50S ribosomal protein L3 [Chloroflexi bacterium]|nr:MAG: 50S ribosomal protein L3 [Chloroflexota bacterium]